MIKIEIVAQDISELFAKLRGLLAGSLELADPPNEREKAEALVELPKTTKRRTAVDAKEPKHTVEVAKVVDGSQPLIDVVDGVTVTMVRESLLALLQIGDDEPETLLAAFQVKRVKDIPSEEYPKVHAAAVARLKAWQDKKK